MAKQAGADQPKDNTMYVVSYDVIQPVKVVKETKDHAYVDVLGEHRRMRIGVNIHRTWEGARDRIVADLQERAEAILREHDEVLKVIDQWNKKTPE